MQVGVVGVGRHRVLGEHELVRAHVASVARRVGEHALATLVEREVGEVADRRRALRRRLGQRRAGRARRPPRNGGGVSAGDQRGPSQNCRVRGSQVMFVREPSATTSTVSPSSPAISVCASPFEGCQSTSSTPIAYVRTSLRPRGLPAEAAALQDQEHLVLVGVAVRRRRALAGIDPRERDAEPLGARRGTEPPARRGELADLPAVDGDVVEVERKTVGHPGRMKHAGSLERR